MYNEVFIFDLKHQKWSLSSETTESEEDTPMERDSHSSAVYKNKMIVFGGRGWSTTTEYLSDLYSMELIQTNEMSFKHDWKKLGKLYHPIIS